jgi:hypothetical protein
MESEPKKSGGFLDQLRDAAQVALEKTRSGVEDLQQRHELSQTYGALGRKTAELVESGAISHPELTKMVDEIRELKAAELAAEPETEPDAPAG